MGNAEVAVSPDEASRQRPPALIRYWWVFPLFLLGCALLAAAFNREKPLTLDDADPAVLQSARAPAGIPGPRQPWTELRYTSHQVLTSKFHGTVESKVKTRLESLGSGVLRRSDDWYDPLGQRALYEERVLSWNGLVALKRLQREPASVYHDIFANQGWLGQQVRALSLAAEPGFPLEDGKTLKATIRRNVKAIPGSGKPDVEKERQLACRVDKSIDGRQLVAQWTDTLPRVACEAVERQVSPAPSDPAPMRASSEYVFLPAYGIFLPLSWAEDEPRSPFAEPGSPVTQSSTKVLYKDFEVRAR